jgi:transketolase
VIAPTTDPASLRALAATLRARVVETSGRAEVPHLGSCLSCADILVALYWGVLRLDPGAPTATGRDRFILSKGHAAPALFQVLALRGYYPEAELAD